MAMSVYNRRQLRQSLSLEYIHDGLVGTTTATLGGIANLEVHDVQQSDSLWSGQSLYERAWGRLLGSTGPMVDFRIASFNVATGTFVSFRPACFSIYIGMPYEVHTKISPAEKDRILTETIQSLRERKEIAIWSVKDQMIYSLGYDVDVLDVHYQGDPAGSLDRDIGYFSWWKVAMTPTGQELRLSSSLEASECLIIDAYLPMSLGALDTATVNLEDREVVMAGAEARCWRLLSKDAPGKESMQYRQMATEAGRRFSALAARFQPHVTREIQFDNNW